MSNSFINNMFSKDKHLNNLFLQRRDLNNKCIKVGVNPTGSSAVFLMAALIFSLLLSASNASSTPYLSLEDLKLQVKDFTRNHYMERFPSYEIEVNVTKLDSRTKLQQCDDDLSLEAPKVLNRSGNSLISVRCVSPVPWRIFVPAKVAIIREVLVAAGPIARNSVVNSSNTRKKKVSLNSFRTEYVSDVEGVTGMIAKRSFRDGQAIIVGQLTTPTLVKRGDSVVISAKSGSTQVKISGIAQAAGKRGDQILVKNSHSNRSIKAMVIGRGRVAVTL